MIKFFDNRIHDGANFMFLYRVDMFFTKAGRNRRQFDIFDKCRLVDILALPMSLSDAICDQ
jgi:hypothetical protein